PGQALRLLRSRKSLFCPLPSWLVGEGWSVSRGQAVDLRQNPLLQVLVLHVLCQSVEAVRVLDCVAADDLADAAARLSGPVFAGERGRRPGWSRRDVACAIIRACPPD